MLKLSSIISSCRSFRGFSRKRELGDVLNVFGHVSLDDAGFLKAGHFKIVASTDGIVEDIVRADPFMAGFYSVLVNVNDVVSMGARPLGYMNVISSKRRKNRIRMAEGIRAGLNTYGLKLLKGHTHPDQDYESIDACVIGLAKNVISSSGAKVGDEILMAIDLKGSITSRGWVNCFDSVMGSSRKKVLTKLSSLSIIAEKQLANASRDISAPGILGSLAMMCESSRVGSRCDLESIPKPDTVNLLDWLKIYPSIGFFVSTGKPDKCCRIFEKCGLTAKRIGVATSDRLVVLSTKDDEGVFVDLNKESVFGLMQPWKTSR